MKPTKLLYPVIMGWFIGSAAQEPAYEPGHVPCPYCGVYTTDDNVRTFNLMAEDREPMLSVFYRCHRTCNEDATDDGKKALDDYTMQMLEMLRAQPPAPTEGATGGRS